MNIRRLVKKEIVRLKAYNAQETSCRIKLDANESPYGFGEALGAVSDILTNRYPDPDAKALKTVLAQGMGIRRDQILQGNGSDELIYYLIATFGGPVLYPVPTFSMYGIISQALGERIREVPLDGGFDIDLPNMLSAIKREKPRIIFLSSPNNPTGNCFSSDRILKVIESAPGIVVIDEAYHPFSSVRGFLPLLRDYKNLVVMRTLSKVGLAALRFGFLLAHPEVVREVNKVRLPFNVNALSQAVAVSALKEKKKLRSVVKRIVSERNHLFDAMSEIQGITPFPSEANFILFRVKEPVKMHRALLSRGILVRDLHDAVKGCLRVTVGTPEENSAFLKALRGILA